MNDHFRRNSCGCSFGWVFDGEIKRIYFKKKETSDPTLSIEGIATEVFKANGAMEFERIWISFLQNELGKK